MRTENQLSETLALLCSAYHFETLPEDILCLARLALLDNIGCAVKGLSSEAVHIAAQTLLGREFGINDVLPGVRVEGSLEQHTLVRGIAAHAFDFDDTNIAAKASHLGSVTVSAVLSLAPELDSTVEEILVAIVVGYEVAARVGSLLQEDHYLKGFHSTSTIGVFGAAAACGRLLQLSPQQTRVALGMAANQAAGLKCTFGTMAKPFNAGKAASNGLMAARLAAAGFLGPESALEIEKGYLALFMGLPHAERVVAKPDQFFIRSNLFKFYAACHATHPMIELIHQIRREGWPSSGQSQTPLPVSAIKRVRVEVGKLLFKTASVIQPKTGLESKFSFSQVAALTLLNWKMEADKTYSNETLNETEVNELRARISVLEDPGMGSMQTRVTLEFEDGVVVERYLDYLKQSQSLEEIQSKVKVKFLSSTIPIVGEPKAIEVLASIF